MDRPADRRPSYGALARDDGEPAPIQRGHDPFDTWSHRHPMKVAGSGRRSDALGRRTSKDMPARWCRRPGTHLLDIQPTREVVGGWHADSGIDR